MTPEHVEAARGELAKVLGMMHINGASMHIVGADAPERAAALLDRAGMLRTGIEKWAVEACEDMETDDYAEHVRAERRAREIGAASLALKQPPKPRWTRLGTQLRRYETRDLITFPDEASADVAMLAMNRALNACDTEAPSA